MDTKEFIAKRVALELKNGDVVNLGIGLPTMVANYIPDDFKVYLQAENGIIGTGPEAKECEKDLDITNAGGCTITIQPGAAFFDSPTSFAMIRGGHVDVTVLGALQVDEEGNLANWMVPGKKVTGMGGAMDLVVGARRVIIAMEHTAKDGGKKILKKCDFPLTGVKVVHRIITEMAVFDVTDGGLILIETAQGVTVEQIRDATEADFIVSPDLKEFCIA